MTKIMEYTKEKPDCCVFCLTAKQNEVILHCKHTFCRDCLEVYCEKELYNRRCPICRRNFSYYETLSKDPLIVIIDEDNEDSAEDSDIIY